MDHILPDLRRDYAIARGLLGLCNKFNGSTKSKANCMRRLNKCKHALRLEVKRVAWLLWPETGRPGVSCERA